MTTFRASTGPRTMAIGAQNGPTVGSLEEAGSSGAARPPDSPLPHLRDERRKLPLPRIDAVQEGGDQGQERKTTEVMARPGEQPRAAPSGPRVTKLVALAGDEMRVGLYCNHPAGHTDEPAESHMNSQRERKKKQKRKRNFVVLLLCSLGMLLFCPWWAQFARRCGSICLATGFKLQFLGPFCLGVEPRSPGPFPASQPTGTTSAG